MTATYGHDRCCGMHVRKGAQVIGIVGVIIGVLILLGAVLYNHTWGSYLDGIVTIFIYAALIIASQKGEHRWYLPFLILNGIWIILKVLYFLFLVFMMITMPPSWQRYVYDGPRHDYRTTDGRIVTTDGRNFTATDARVVRRDVDAEEEARIQTGFMLAVLLIGLLLNMWFQHVVYRAYKNLKEDNDVAPHSRYIHTTTTTTTPGIANPSHVTVPTTLPAGRV
ncbi:hypothetical protein AAVH_02429 [Aphelenchoides avenae]|nr:hypothetical protein AAVH_02429 [Aphelenchus avenae]